MATRYDAIIIGTGQAGPPLAGRLDREGLSVAIVERKLIGGTCVNTGCVPTKTLVASAKSAHMARRAAEFGVVIDGSIGVDMTRVKARKDQVSGESNRNLTTWLESMESVRLLRGHARFLDPHVVEVNGDRLQAERIFIER